MSRLILESEDLLIQKLSDEPGRGQTRGIRKSGCNPPHQILVWGFLFVRERKEGMFYKLNIFVFVLIGIFIGTAVFAQPGLDEVNF